MKANQKVSVTYLDGKGNHITTVSELADKFKDEHQFWQDEFFMQLDTKGVAFSKWAEYKLLPL